MAKLLQTWVEGGERYRAIKSARVIIVEREERDAMGSPRWVSIANGQFSLDLQYGSTALQVAQHLAYALEAAADARAAVAQTYDYSTGKGT